MRSSFIARAAALAFILSVLPAGSALAGYTNLYAFGDSLTDAGNIYAITTQPNLLGGVLPATPAAPPYYPGRFSNGYNYADQLSIRLFDKPLKPSLLGGTDYAVGGATTGFANSEAPGTWPIPPTGMLAQYQAYNAAHAGTADRNALYLVYGGSNDLLQLFRNLPADTTQWAPMLGAVVTAANNNLTTIIGGLSQAGAQHFLVPNLPDLGLVPALHGSPVQDFAAAASAAFNAALAARLQALDASGLDVRTLDVFDTMHAIIADPQRYGLSNVTDPCYPGVIGAGEPPFACTDPNSYFFWDSLHPTARMFALFGDLAFAAVVPEPGTAALLPALLLALFAAGWRVRRG